METLHPLVIHLPITLVLVVPLIDAVAFFSKKKDIGYLAVGLYGITVVVSLVATATGQAAFDVAVASGVEGKLLNTHADNANLIPWLLIVLLIVRVVLPKKLGRRGHGVALAAGLMMWPLIFQVGQSGGALVFVHGIGVRR